MKSPLLAAALACFSFAAVADESDVRKVVEEKMGKVEKIVKAPMPGIWEVTVDGQVFYSDDKGSHLLFGNLLEAKSGRNLTAERMKEIEKVLLAGSLDSAIKQVRGSGKNVVMTFEDPNCGFCKKLAKEILTLKDVTVYTFLMPVLGDDSFEKSKAIWCAQDKTRAWIDWMTAGKTPPAVPAKCDLTGLNKSTQLGRKLRINGTPAIFFASGERVPGFVPAAEIEKRFSAAGS